MKTKIAVFGLLLCLTLTGCIEVTTVVKVNRDGSGTIELTSVITNSLVELLGGLGQEKKSADDSAVDKEELREKALGMGEGVSLVSAELVTREIGSGVKAVYSFQDVNLIKINQNPAENLPGSQQEKPLQEFVRFEFIAGNPAVLKILQPEYEQAEGDAQAKSKTESAETSADDKQMMEMLRELYKQMKIGFAVEVAGTIVATDATYVEGSQVTIMEMDFEKLMEDDATFDMLAKAQPESMQATKELLSEFPGIKVELQPEVSIRFR